MTNLATDVQYVRGVGPARAREFAALGVRTALDLIEYYPFRHELRPKSQPIGSLELGQQATVVGTLQRVRSRGRLSRVSVTAEVVDGTGACHVRWFNSPFLNDRLGVGEIVKLTGRVELHREHAAFTNPRLTVIDHDADPLAGDEDRYEPVYSGTAALPSAQIAKVVARVLDTACANKSHFQLCQHLTRFH